MSGKTKPPKPPGYEVAVGAAGKRSGVRVEDLLDAVKKTLELLEAAARARGEELPPLYLYGIRDGSARAELRPQKESSARVFEATVRRADKVVKTRAKDATEAERDALLKLHRVGKRIKVKSLRIKDAPKRVIEVREPVELTTPTSRLSKVRWFTGKISGVRELFGGRIEVTLRSRNEPQTVFHAPKEMAEQIRQLLFEDVRIRGSVVLASNLEDIDGKWKLRELKPWRSRKLSEVVTQVADEEEIGADGWLDRLRESREG